MKTELSKSAKRCAWCTKYWVPKRYFKTAKTCSPRCRNALYRSRRNVPRPHNNAMRKIQENSYGAFYVLIPGEVMKKAGLKKGDTVKWYASWGRLDAIKMGK